MDHRIEISPLGLELYSVPEAPIVRLEQCCLVEREVEDADAERDIVEDIDLGEVVIEDRSQMLANPARNEIGLVADLGYPETLNNVFFSLAVHIDGEPHQFERMVLYFHPADGYWLVPEKRGPFIALEQAGLRVDHEAPFLTIHQRAEGVCAAARIIVQLTRNVGVL